MPGLAEGRPSVLVGDRVILSALQGEQEQECQPQYEGYVHEVGSAFFLFNHIVLKVTGDLFYLDDK